MALAPCEKNRTRSGFLLSHMFALTLCGSAISPCGLIMPIAFIASADMAMEYGEAGR